MLKILSYILCDLDPQKKVIGQKAGICDGVPSTSALVFSIFIQLPDSIFTVSQAVHPGYLQTGTLANSEDQMKFCLMWHFIRVCTVCKDQNKSS